MTISIKVKPRENINRALSRFKSAVMNEGIMKDEMKVIRKLQNEEREWRQR